MDGGNKRGCTKAAMDHWISRGEMSKQWEGQIRNCRICRPKRLSRARLGIAGENKLC
jgi:hypothetical protein